MFRDELEIATLLELSSRLGRNPCLVQAGNGNISVKLGCVLWVKASGKWLVNGGQEEILVPVDLASARAAIARGIDPSTDYTTSSGNHLRASTETAMHVVLPHRVVIHVHSVSTIAFAVRHDGPEQLAALLNGLPWAWIPYVVSGLPLARKIQNILAGEPDTRVLVLGNHGLVVCGDTCEDADALLATVEERLGAAARPCPQPDIGRVTRLFDVPGWHAPKDPVIQGLATDPVTRAIATEGVLYPCHAIFLGSANSDPNESLGFSEAGLQPELAYGNPAKFFIIPDEGVIVNDSFTLTEYQMLLGLAEVARRIESGVRVRYLTGIEIAALGNAGTHPYRQLVERNDRTHEAFAAGVAS